MNTTKQDRICTHTHTHRYILYILFICGYGRGSVDEGRLVEGAGRNNESIMESFKRELDCGALIVNTKSQVVIRLENWHLKVHLSIKAYG